MEKTESITKLAHALCKAQAEMSGAKKSAENPFFKSQYANLEEVINCVREPFANHGLSFMQFPISSDGFAGVNTIIMHESGEYISESFMLKCSKNDPQGMGSAITYAKRYGLQGAVGLPSEDDDGNAATAKAKPLEVMSDDGWYEWINDIKGSKCEGMSLGQMIVECPREDIWAMNEWVGKQVLKAEADENEAKSSHYKQIALYAARALKELDNQPESVADSSTAVPGV